MAKKEKDAVSKEAAKVDGKAALAKALEKKKGHPAIWSMAEENFQNSTLRRFSSGELGLDIALGGGWPRGRFIKIAGPYSSSKSTLIASAIADLTVRHGEDILLIDVEGTYTKDWLAAKGADVSRVYLSRPETAEESFDIAESGLESNEYSAIFIDSIAAMTPLDEMDKAHDEWTRGLLARIVSKFCRKVTGRMNRALLGGKEIPTIFVTNQIRTNLNNTYKPEFTPGGSQQDNTASVIVELYPMDRIYEGTQATPEEERNYVGRNILATVTKNKVSPPFKRTRFGILNEQFYGHPANTFFHADTIMRFAMKIGLITLAGAWYAYGEQKWQGKNNLYQAIMEDKEFRTKLVGEIKEMIPYDIHFNPDFLPSRVV